MKKFIAEMSKKRTAEINPVLFDRTQETSIADYIISGLKVIESLPYIKFVKWEHITDASKIDIKLNKRHIKNRDIIKDKEITKMVSIRDTAQEMLRMEFIIDFDGDTRYIKKNLLIPSYVDPYHMYINSKEVLPQKQIVDMSTYNQKKSVKLKTTLTPIDIYREEVKNGITSTSGETFRVKKYILNLFTKEINPLYYYLAKFAVHGTIRYFGFKDIIDITDSQFDTNINYYFETEKNLYIEVDKRFFDNNETVRMFTAMVKDIFDQKVKIEYVDNIEYWVTKLGAMFTTNTKNQLNKGYNVLVSFDRILDDITKNNLRLDKRHLQSTFSLIRWLLLNFSDLRKKDNHNLETKRIRCNEVTAFYFIQKMAERVNVLLNRKKLSIESIEKIFNFNPDELFKLMISNKNTLLKYDADINCFELLNALRFSFLGSQGISGGKNIGMQFRDIYPSHLGRIDLNGVSHGKNTALTGFIVPRCKIYGNGYFAKESNDPDSFNDEFNKLRKKLYNVAIENRKQEIFDIKYSKLESEAEYIKSRFEKRDGCIVVHRRPIIHKNLDTNEYVISSRNPLIGYRKTYRNENGQKMSYDDRYVISRRRDINKSNDRFIIKPSDGSNYIRISANQRN